MLYLKDLSEEGFFPLIPLIENYFTQEQDILLWCTLLVEVFRGVLLTPPLNYLTVCT